jgi:hypothetical protein
MPDIYGICKAITTAPGLLELVAEALFKAFEQGPGVV